MGTGEAIIADHDEFRKTLANIEKTTGGDVDFRKQVLPQEKLRAMALDLTEKHRA
jgi:hypothetical protein